MAKLKKKKNQVHSCFSLEDGVYSSIMGIINGMGTMNTTLNLNSSEPSLEYT